ncbi:MAG: hypothetical protein EPN45_12145 [Rhizobiaceae bacterium]|nr:MAG: hypothetical protein EPN45_12145 [Rhizobiaceae bacterium]
MNLNDENEQLIETLFRNGTLTVVGIIFSFSLGFLAQWGANPLPWRLYDAFPVAALCIGIIIQFRALALLLHTDSVKKHLFQKASRVFLIGAMTTGAGVFLAIAADLIAQTTR